MPGGVSGLVEGGSHSHSKVHGGVPSGVPGGDPGRVKEEGREVSTSGGEAPIRDDV